jgi:protein-S-isoprenylcysteine O-methyltransferase Ste14
MAQNPDHAPVRLPPPLMLLGHLAAALLFGWLLPLPLPLPGPVRLIGILIVLVGLALAGAAVQAMIAAHTPLDPYEPVVALVLQGPYRISRNPVYLSFVGALIGLPLALGTYWGLFLSPVMIVLLTLLVIRYEEGYLERKFGEQYLSYKVRVPRWL